MAGYREFQTGEVLTAANVNNFLMEQATMTFADAAARDAALAGVLRAGLNVYLEDTDRLQYYDGTDWENVPNEADVLAAGNAGIGSNVVQTVKTDTFSTSSSSFTAVTGLSVTITPTSATSKVLVLATVSGGNSLNDLSFAFNLRRGSTNIAQPSAGADAATWQDQVRDNVGGASMSIQFLDSPSTTDPVTYSITARSYGGTVFVNRTQMASRTSVSSITAIEVAP